MTSERQATTVDCLVIGGGVNGAGTARDLAGRGLSVALFEMNDLASATSSASTKLIHGGLRYLEQYEFALVRKSLIERARLLKLAPHLIWPLRLILPHDPTLRPKWMLRAGLFLYDTIGGRGAMEPSRQVTLDGVLGAPLNPRYTSGFAYSDAWVDDSRLVALLARDAADHGARIHTRTRVERAYRENGAWRVETVDDLDRHTVWRARALVNAAGPWAAEVLSRTGANAVRSLRLVKGSHLVVRRVYEGEHAYFFQNDDGRVMFVIPYEGDFTLIGTTDTPHDAAPALVSIDESEIDYLLTEVNKRLAAPLSRADVVWSFAGVRPLLDDGEEAASEVTRGYALELDTSGGAPLLNVWGGKLTTFRALSEEAADTVAQALGLPKSDWTRTAPLPGADMPDADFERFFSQTVRDHAWAPPPLLHRLARAYGSDLKRILGSATALADLGRDFGGGLTEAELIHMTEREWARSAEDALWRRSKLGLHLSVQERAAVQAWFDARPSSAQRGEAQTTPV